MDIKRKESKLVISNQSSVIKTPKKKRLVLGFKKHSSYETYLSNMTNFLFKTKKRKLIFSLFLVLLVIAPISFYLWNKQAGASWWNSDWFYRKAITVTNSSGSTLENFQVKILTNYDLSGDISSGKIQSDLDDLRFMINDGESLDYWIEDNTINSADIWIKIPSLQTSGATVYMYYGNPQATTQSDGNKVFDFFDDFNIFNETKWSATGDKSIANGKLTVTTGAVYSKNTVATTPQNKTIEMKAKYLNNANVSDDYSGINISEAQGTNSNNSWGHALAYNMTQLRAPYNLVAFGSDGSAGGYGIVDDVNIYDQTLNTDYIIGYTFQGASNIKYFVKDLNYADLGSVTPSGTWNYSFYLWLGLFKGVNSGTQDIDDVEVDWVRVRKYASSDPIMTIGQEEQGPSPVLYLPFDEGFGTTAHDETSNRNDGTIVGATWKDESMCKNGKCLEFDGNGDYVEINDNKSLDLDKEVTLEAWVKPTSTTPENQTIISKEETTNDPTKIYRSVAPGATSAIAVGTSNAMNITGDRATFATSLPNNVGVGDAIQYDSDNDNDIDASDSIVFIKERVTSYEFLVATANGGAPIPVNSDTNWSLFRAYISLANAEKGVENTGIDSDLRNFDDWTAGGDATTDDVGKDLVASNQQWNIACYANGTTGDTTAVAVDGWTTGANNRIKIYTPVYASEVGESQRHGTVWNTSKYRVELNGNVISIFEEYVDIDGLQIYKTGATLAHGIVVNPTGAGISIIRNNIVRGPGPGASEIGITLEANASNIKAYIYNNIVYNYDRGIFPFAFNSAHLYNNTVYNCGICFSNLGGSVLKNNIANNCLTESFNGSSGILSTNNLTNSVLGNSSAFGATYTTGTTNATTASKLVNSGATFITNGIQVGSIIKNTTDNTYTYVTALDSETQLSLANDIFISGEAYSIYKNKYGNVSFVSTTAGSEDFHLSPTDTVAKNSGADLSGDSVFPFNSDIDGQQRLYLPNGGPNSADTKFDIGADEAQATQIYRSVAPGKTDALETGIENAMTINGNTATFQRALADNIGVGDVIQYDDDNDGDIDSSDSLAFITGRISNFQYTITNASGGTPVPVNSDTNWSLFRAYTSLANAENGDENTGIDSDLRNFDSWTGGKDLVTSKEQWNIACYANGTTADSTAVTVDGWTTGVQNFVKIYTPVSESEVGVSQRHSGRWDEGKYKLETGAGAHSIYVYEDFTVIDGVQITNSGTASTDDVINISGWRSFNIISNNIIKGGYNGINITFWLNTGGHKIYNNIVYGAYASGIRNYCNTSIAGYISYFYNNTVFNCNIGNVSYSRGISITESSLGNHGVYNNIAINNLGSDIFSSGQSYNITSDASATGTGSLINQTLNEIDFVSTTPGSEDLHILGTSVARNAGANLSNDPNMPFKIDIDGDKRLDLQEGGTTSWDIGADEAAATKIYRSVGPNNTTALATDEGHKNVLNVLNGEVSFSSSLPDRVGVGDAVLIDTNNDNAITSADTLLFIHSRNSSTSYILRTHTGAVPSNISSNDTYQIFRAYTSLANAESGTKNTSIPMTFNGGNRDLVTNNEEWNIACYKDAIDIVSVGAGIQIEDWNTGIENFIKIFTPVNSIEVGISQRHKGMAGTGYQIKTSINTTIIGIQELNISIDGLEFNGINIGGSNMGINSGYLVVGDFNLVISNNLLFNFNNMEWRGAIHLSGGGAGSVAKVFNNIVSDASNTNGGVGIRIDNVINAFIFNNTIYNCNKGIDPNSYTVAKNNITQNCLDGFTGTFDTFSDFNISNLAADAPGANSKNSTTVTFRDAANKDFRLAMTDTAAKGAGINLSNDANLPITHDIEGELRPGFCGTDGGDEACLVSTGGVFDIGADQISGTIHRNYSLTLDNDYPRAYQSTGNDDNESFSSGDINLPANEWSHIVYKRDNDREELYINGSKKDSGTISNFLKTNNGKLYLGAKDTNSTNSFKGFLDEVRIYPYARTEAEVKKDTTAGSSGRAAARASEGVGVAIGDSGNSLSDGLVGYWKMDETSWNGTANEVIDHSGNNNHGVASGGASTTAGKFGNGGGFDGVDDRISLTGKSFGDSSEVITFSTWVNLSYLGNSETIFNYGDQNACAAGGGFIWIYKQTTTNNLAYQHCNGSTYPMNLFNDFFSGHHDRWLYLTVISDFKKNTIDVYRNGEYFGSKNSSEDMIFPAVSNAFIGSYKDAYFLFKGGIDETRIYNRALSPDEIKQLYNYAPGPVLHLKLDEKTGTTAFDSSGNNNHGTLTNGPIWENGKINSGINFDGVDDYINVTNSPNLKLLGDMTIEAWINPRDITDPTNYSAIIKRGTDNSDTSANNYYQMTINPSGNLLFYTRGNTLTTFDLNNDLNKWIHLACVSNSGITKCYKNGVQHVTTGTHGTGVPYSDTATYIGAAKYTADPWDDYFDGLIDDIRVYNYARTPEQILEDMNAQSSSIIGSEGNVLQKPILDLNFDEGQGATAFDSSGNNNHGTLVSGATGINTTPTMMWDKGGKEGGAMEFDGMDDYVTLNDNGSLDLDVYTISAWIYPYVLGGTGTGTGATIYANYSDTDVSPYNGVVFSLGGFGASNGGQLRLFHNNNNVTTFPMLVSGSAIISTNKWQQVVATLSGNDLANLYIDGEKVASGTITETADFTNSTPKIGRAHSNTSAPNDYEDFNGLIDQVKIYNYALSEDEIKTLYNGSSAMAMGTDESRNNNGTEVTGAKKDYCVPGDTAKCDKPILELKMDEMTGTIAKDTSGNGNNGTLRNGPVWDRGKVGNSLNFNGTSQDINNIPNVNIQGNFTISAWIKPETLSGERTIFYATSDFFVMQWNNSLNWRGDMSNCLLDGSGVRVDIVGVSNVVTKDEWQYVNFVSDATNNKIYIYRNGRAVLDQAGKSDCAPTNNTENVGSTNSRYFDGNIDEVRIYDYARTPAQIAWDYNRGKPMGHWKMDESSGTQVDDWSGNANHGTMTNMDPIGDRVAGKNNKALDFDGIDDYVNIDSIVNSFNNKKGSFSAWVKRDFLDTVSTDKYLFHAYYNNGNFHTIRYLKGTDQWEFAVDRAYTHNTVKLDASTVPQNVWTHVLMTWDEDGDDVKVYINGENKGSNSAGGSYVAVPTIGRIGTDRTNLFMFDGLIDDVKIFNYELTGEQVKLDYNNGAVNFR